MTGMEVSYYKILKLKTTASEKEVRDAYKALILSAHPVKGGCAQRFRQLQAAYEILRDATSRKTYDEKLRDLKRKRSFHTPDAMPEVKAPYRCFLPNGVEYVFETAPDRLRCRFRHGDVVEDVVSGQRGIVVGMASTGIFWCHQGSSVAVPMSTFGGDKDIVVVFRSGVGKGGAAPSETTQGRYRTASQQPSGYSGPPGGRSASASSSDHLKQRAREGRAEMLKRQRDRVVAACLTKLVRDEAARRSLLASEVEKYFEQLFDTCQYDRKMILRARRTGALQPPSTPAVTSSGQRPVRSASAGVTRRPLAQAVPPDVPAGDSTTTRSATPSRTVRSSSLGAGTPRAGVRRPSTVAGFAASLDAPAPVKSTSRTVGKAECEPVSTPRIGVTPTVVPSDRFSASINPKLFSPRTPVRVSVVDGAKGPGPSRTPPPVISRGRTSIARDVPPPSSPPPANGVAPPASATENGAASPGAAVTSVPRLRLRVPT